VRRDEQKKSGRAGSDVTRWTVHAPNNTAVRWIATRFL
jgi:hypothetical protein